MYAGTDQEPPGVRYGPLRSSGPMMRIQLFATTYHRLQPTGRHPQCAQQSPTASSSGLLPHLDTVVAEAIASQAKAAGIVQLRSVGGAVNDTIATGVTYAHRSQPFSLMASTVLRSGERPRPAWEEIAPHLDGLHVYFEAGTSNTAVSGCLPWPRPALADGPQSAL